MPRKSKRSDKSLLKQKIKENKTFKKEKILILSFSVILLFAFFLALKYDVLISKFFQFIRFPLLNYLIFTTNFLSSGIILFAIISALFLVPPRIKNIIKVWLTLILSYLIGVGLKVLFARLRPFQAGVVTTFPQLAESFSSWNSSFPSLHSTIVFTALPFLLHEKKVIKYSWFAFCVIVALSRVYLGLHYLSDVIAGGVLGYLIGFLILKTDTKIKNKLMNNDRKIKKDIKEV